MFLFYVWLMLYIQISNGQTVPTVKYVRPPEETTESAQETKSTAPTIPIDYECSMQNAISTIVVKQNNLIDICELEKEYQISFKIYIKKYQFRKTILNVLGGKSKKKKILTIKTTGKGQKLRFKGILDEHEEEFKVVTKEKVALEKWNKINIIQEVIQGGFVSIIYYVMFLKFLN